MALKEKLDAIREASSKRIPPDRQAIMQRATADLRASGIMSRIVKVGQPMPAFAGTRTGTCKSLGTRSRK